MRVAPGGTWITTTSYVFNNTLTASTYYRITANLGYLALSNNIILGSYYGSIAAVNGATVRCDYKLLTNGIATGGVVNSGRKVIDPGLGFVSAANGLFWLRSTSPDRNKA